MGSTRHAVLARSVEPLMIVNGYGLFASMTTQRPELAIEGSDDAQALFSYHLHAMPNEVTNRLSTSTALAAWNAAVYVAQIEDERVAAAMHEGSYLQVTNDVVLKHGGLWFQDESFAVVRA